MKPKRKWAYQSSCDAAVNPTACYRKNARKVCGNGIDLDQNQMHLWQNLPRPRCPRTAHAPGISPIEIAMEPQHLHKLRPDYGAVLLGLDRLPDQIEEKTLTLFDRNQFQATSSVDRTIGSNAITDCTSVNTGPLGFKNISARKVITLYSIPQSHKSIATWVRIFLRTVRHTKTFTPNLNHLSLRTDRVRNLITAQVHISIRHNQTRSGTLPPLSKAQ
ncbi:hypothetical protein [Ketobacter sp.]